jgi:hypothetical protein
MCVFQVLGSAKEGDSMISSNRVPGCCREREREREIGSVLILGM